MNDEEPIKTGAKFDSFRDFETTLERWKSENFHPFRVASSETLRMPDGSTNETFKYRYIVYHCAHYGTPRMRGIGKRPNQNYMPCGCRAMLRLNYSWTENALRVTTLNVEHLGHDVSAEAYSRFASKAKRHCGGFHVSASASPSPGNNENKSNVATTTSASSSPVATTPPSVVATDNGGSHATTLLSPADQNSFLLQQRRLVQLDMGGVNNRLYHQHQQTQQQQQLLQLAVAKQQQQKAVVEAAGGAYLSAANYLPTFAGALLELYCQQQQSLYANFATTANLHSANRATTVAPPYERVATLQPILHNLADHLLNVASGEEFDEKINNLKTILNVWRSGTGVSAKEIMASEKYNLSIVK